jgi:hypothetical protein
MPTLQWCVRHDGAEIDVLEEDELPRLLRAYYVPVQQCGRSSPCLPSMYLEMADLFDPFTSSRPLIAARIICSRNMCNKHATLLVVSSLHFALAITPLKVKKPFLYCLVKQKRKKPPTNTHPIIPTL